MRHHSFRSEEYAGVRQEVGSAIGKAKDEDELFFKLRKHFDYNVYPFYAPDRNTALALALSSVTRTGDLYLCSPTSYVYGRGYTAIKNIAGIRIIFHFLRQCIFRSIREEKSALRLKKS